MTWIFLYVRYQTAVFNADPLIDGRRNPERYKPFDDETVIALLEGALGLSESRKTPGRIATYHDAAYRYWLELINKGSLKTKFDIVHVDAHGDLGIGGLDGDAWDIVEENSCTFL